MNTKEHLIGTINYKEIKINQDGKPLVNQELLDFLFGRGKTTEKNTEDK